MGEVRVVKYYNLARSTAVFIQHVTRKLGKMVEKNQLRIPLGSIFFGGWATSVFRMKSSIKQISGSTISTLLHDRINPKDCQVLFLGDTGVLQFFRVVSRDYGKPRNPLNRFDLFIRDVTSLSS